jgi:hypothetical protein
MSIDVNEDVKVWQGFSQGQFWGGAAALLGIAALALLVSVKVNQILGCAILAVVGGGFAAFMVLLRDLPKGYLLLRLKQEGRFFFVRIPGLRGVDLYLAPGSERGSRFEREFGGTKTVTPPAKGLEKG